MNTSFVKLGLVGVVFMFLLLPSCLASLGTFKQNDCVPIRVLANCTSVDLVEVTINNNNSFIINEPMTLLGGQTFNYSFCNTSELGGYSYSWDNPCIDCSQGNCGNDFEVTYNGNKSPEGIVIVFFSIGFLIVIGALAYLFIYNLGHFAQMDYDLGDLIKNVSAYFVLVALYLLEIFYMGNKMINDIMVWIIGITGFTNVGIAFLAFIICLIAKRKAELENA